MNRRCFIFSFITGVFTLFGLSSVPTLLAGVHDKDYELQGIDREIQKLFSDAESAKTVGKRYLALNPHKSFRAGLLKDSGLKVNCITPPGSSSYLKKEFDICRENDFLVGNTIMVDGWVLSQSEVSLCAFLALKSYCKGLND